MADVCEAIVDCPHRTAPTQTQGTPQIRTTDIKNGRLDLRSAKRVSEETYREWTARAEPRAGDLILAREAPVGEVGIVPPGERVCQGQRTVLLRPDPQRVVPRYLLYLLLTPEMRERMLARAEGSTTPHLNVADVRRLRLPELPRIEEQRPVADLLGALDDKIESNWRMNETLEAIARATFKSWFVDFDPVRAKIAGNLPIGMDRGTAALFPGSLMDSALGSLPSGWTPGSLMDVVDVLSGGTPSTSVPEYWAGDVPWFTVVDTPRLGDVFVTDTERTITDVGLASCGAELLPHLTTIVTARGTVGNVALTARPMAMNQSCYGISGKNGYGSFFSHYLVRRAVETLRQRTHGSVFETITRDTLKSIEIVIPPVELSAAFDREIRTYLDRILANLEESATLAELRDTLLPRLISGETRLPQSGVA